MRNKRINATDILLLILFEITISVSISLNISHHHQIFIRKVSTLASFVQEAIELTLKDYLRFMVALLSYIFL